MRAERRLRSRIFALISAALIFTTESFFPVSFLEFISQFIVDLSAPSLSHIYDVESRTKGLTVILSNDNCARTMSSAVSVSFSAAATQLHPEVCSAG